MEKNVEDIIFERLSKIMMFRGEMPEEGAAKEIILTALEDSPFYTGKRIGENALKKSESEAPTTARNRPMNAPNAPQRSGAIG